MIANEDEVTGHSIHAQSNFELLFVLIPCMFSTHNKFFDSLDNVSNLNVTAIVRIFLFFHASCLVELSVQLLQG